MNRRTITCCPGLTVGGCIFGDNTSQSQGHAGLMAALIRIRPRWCFTEHPGGECTLHTGNDFRKLAEYNVIKHTVLLTLPYRQRIWTETLVIVCSYPQYHLPRVYRRLNLPRLSRELVDHRLYFWLNFAWMH